MPACLPAAWPAFLPENGMERQKAKRTEEIFSRSRLVRRLEDKWFRSPFPTLPLCGVSCGVEVENADSTEG